MRKIFLVIALLLTSCIQVDDLAGYWEKGEVDPLLEGAWFTSDKQTAYKMVKKDGLYLLEVPGARPDQPQVQVRSIKSRNFSYMMMRSKNAEKKDVTALIRYKLDGDNLIISEPTNAKLLEWVRQQKAESYFKAGGGLAFVMIPKMDGQALSVLDSMPDNEVYWKSGVLRKLK